MINAIIVDDDFDTVEVFGEFLTLSGINVLGKAYNGKEGVELYERIKPDIVFADMIMPRFDGFYLLSELKSKWPQSNIIMVTADMREEYENKLMEFGADAVIFKPYRSSHIKAAIKHILENKKINHFKYCRIFQ